MQFQHNDGGRSNYSSRPGFHDCVIRAVAIATGRPYNDVYAEIRAFAPNLESEGVNVGSAEFKTYMAAQGFICVSGLTTMQDIPEGRVIARTTGHYTAIINGVINDVRDESFKAVQYYWIKGAFFDLYRNGTQINRAPLTAGQALSMRATLYRYNPAGSAIHLKEAELC